MAIDEARVKHMIDIAEELSVELADRGFDEEGILGLASVGIFLAHALDTYRAQ